MNYRENPELCRTIDHISEAISSLKKVIEGQEDVIIQYELGIVQKNLEASQRTILYGLFQT